MKKKLKLKFAPKDRQAFKEYSDRVSTIRNDEFFMNFIGEKSYFPTEYEDEFLFDSIAFDTFGEKKQVHILDLWDIYLAEPTKHEIVDSISSSLNQSEFRFPESDNVVRVSALPKDAFTSLNGSIKRDISVTSYIDDMCVMKYSSKVTTSTDISYDDLATIATNLDIMKNKINDILKKLTDIRNK